MVRISQPQPPARAAAVTAASGATAATTRRSNQFAAVPFRVLYDDRERVGGWRFQGLTAGSKKQYRQLIVDTKEVHLKTGDYTAELPDGTRLPVLIERKSGDDLLGSISGGHQRFRAEHERMREHVYDGWHCCVIVEASLDDLIDQMESPEWTRKASSELLLGCTASWPVQHGVPWYFAGDRAAAERLALKVLWKAWDEQRR